MKLRSTANILNTLSDDRSLLVFRVIALSNSEGSSGDTVVSRLDLSRNQYYSSMSKLAKANLVKRKNKKYYLTNLGNIVYDAQNIIANAINDYWKLKTVDNIEMSDKFRLSETEYNNLTDTLIDNADIKDILVRHHHHGNAIEKRKTTIQNIRYATTKTTIQKR